MRQYYVYILASDRRGTLYVGVTNDLLRRVQEHKRGESDFTARYAIYDLVYYESTSDVYAALTREKQIKKWNREWKVELIEKRNPEWKDLYDEIAMG
jgi:putative endonuclease